eukprot:COSAG06_NODE_274_length_18646_cov_21.468539_3_plen_122_part_00
MPCCCRGLFISQSFGGDPNRVTVFGQSSGGTAVFALLASPKAAGLFQRAYSLSGSPRMDAPLAATRHHALTDPDNFVQKSKCASFSSSSISSSTADKDGLLSCLLALGPEDIIAATPASCE